MTLPGVSVTKLNDCREEGKDLISKQLTVIAKHSEDHKHVVLENKYVKAILNTDNTELVSFIHKESGREAIAQGSTGNRFVLFEDMPNYWDAWDVDIFHLEKPLPLKGTSCKAEIIEEGPLRASVRFQITLTEKCKITQVVQLNAFSRRLDFVNNVEWNESHKILKTEFNLSPRSLSATYETQFGHIERPTHMNTSWDMAKFEVCGHRWADLSEYGFGVSLLNDCKYGYSTLGSTMRLSLLRAPKLPDHDADMGEHTFTFSLFPHTGSFQSAGTIREGTNLNTPLLTVLVPGIASCPSGTKQSLCNSLFELSGDSDSTDGAAVVEAVKLDEETKSSLVVRICERYGGSSMQTLTLPGCKAKSAEFVNLLEHKLENAHLEECDDTKVRFSLKPFEIKTIKLNF